MSDPLARRDANDSDSTPDTEQLRSGIADTRDRMSDTLSELGERLNPQLLKHNVTERVKTEIHDATIGRVEHMAQDVKEKAGSAGTSIRETLADNPIPAAMVAIGLAWMMFNGKDDGRDDRNGRRDYRPVGRNRPYARGTYGAAYGSAYGASYGNDEGYRSPYGDAYGYGEQGGQNSSRSVRSAGGYDADGNRVADAASSAKDSIRQGAEHLADRGHELYDDVADRASQLTDNIADQAQTASRVVAQRTRQGARRVEDSFHEHPLAIGAAAIAVGLMVGMSAPETDREIEWMGDARKQVGDRARAFMHDATDKATDVAEKVASEAKRVIKEETANEPSAENASQTA